MKLLKDLLEKNNLRVSRYEKVGKVIIVDTNSGKYAIKKVPDNNDIFNYLITRNFNFYPDIIDYNGRYQITQFIDNINIPNEQKMNDLIKLVAMLHLKTSYYRELDESEYKKLYEDLSNNIEYLQDYYNDLITIIDTKVYMSPPEYLLARNIAIIFSSLEYCHGAIDNWYKSVQKLDKYRVAVIHNNLNLDHYLKNGNDYLISWDKAKISMPIFDLYKLYNSHVLDFEFSDILKKYESIFPLEEEEKKLLFILISMPKKIEFIKSNYEMCRILGNELDRIYKTDRLIKKSN